MEEHIHGGDLSRFENCLDFSASTGPLGVPEGVLKAVEDSFQYLNRYPQPDARELRGAIAKREGVTPSQVVCGAGATGLMFSLARALSPRETLLTAPAFAEYERAVRAAGSGVRLYYRREESGFALGEDYLSFLREGGDVAFLCNPNNPEGRLIQEGLLLDILRECERSKIFLVMDECFLDLSPEGEGRSLVPLLDTHPNLFILRAFTKSAAIPSLRLGYGITKNEELLSRLRDGFIPWEVSGPAQAAGLAALREEAFFKESRALILLERERLVSRLRDLGLKPYPSDANFILFRGPEGLFEECVKHGILIRDCGNFRGLGPGFYRIAVRTREENDQLLQVMEEVVRKDLGKEVGGTEAEKKTGGTKA